MSSTVDQLIWATAPFCALGDASARTTATVIETKPTSRSRTSENTPSGDQPDQGEDLVERDGRAVGSGLTATPGSVFFVAIVAVAVPPVPLPDDPLTESDSSRAAGLAFDVVHGPTDQ